MRRNKTLTYLAKELQSCNEQRLACERIFVHCSMCVDELADEAIAKVQPLLEKPEIKSCRIPLEIDFENMTELDYWLKSDIFRVDPVERSEPLRQKIERLVYMLQELQLKILQVDPEYAEQVFKRMAALQKKSSNNLPKYMKWRVCNQNPTMKQLEEQQAQLTTDMLINGIMEYAEDPFGDEIAEVNLEKLMRFIKHGQKFPKNFKDECAKLKRYSYWLGEHLFMIDYQKIYTYLFSHCFEKFTKEQRIALYEYDVQMKQIHEDMARLKPELAKYLCDSQSQGTLEGTTLFAPYLHIKEMLKGDWFEKNRADKKYDGRWADAFAEALMRSEYGSQIVDDWKEKDYKIKGYVIGCLKEAGVFQANTTKDGLARDADIMKNYRTFGRYIGKESQEQPYTEWILQHVNDYC